MFVIYSRIPQRYLNRLSLSSALNCSRKSVFILSLFSPSDCSSSVEHAQSHCYVSVYPCQFCLYSNLDHRPSCQLQSGIQVNAHDSIISEPLRATDVSRLHAQVAMYVSVYPCPQRQSLDSISHSVSSSSCRNLVNVHESIISELVRVTDALSSTCIVWNVCFSILLSSMSKPRFHLAFCLMFILSRSCQCRSFNRL